MIESPLTAEDEEFSHKTLERLRWRNTPCCPYCRSLRASSMAGEKRYHCNECNTSYSVTAQTIFHKTRLSLDIWFFAIHLILSTRGTVSARRLGMLLGINKDSACRISHKIQVAMHDSEQRVLLLAIADYVALIKEKETPNGYSSDRIP